MFFWLFFVAILLDFIVLREPGFFSILLVVSYSVWLVVSGIRAKISYRRIMESKKESKRLVDIQMRKEWEEKFRKEELKHRHLHTYPPDWMERKFYFNKKYNGTCQKCGDSSRTMHTHHIIPLSKGGDNAEENLILLCEMCHEKEHPHMLIKRLEILTKQYKRTRLISRKKQRLEVINEIREKLGLPKNLDVN